ncbi:MAG: aspartate kinase [Proteobacteria bacterium]|jgi:aspartate kinase|nr:aspartate kinase [Pseudomonadota bacterium]
MIVMKFGGSSLEDRAAMERVVSIVASRVRQRPVVVVSAMGDTTDTLVSLLAAVERGDAPSATRIAAALGDAYRSALFSLGADGPMATARLEREIAGLERYVGGMLSLGEISPRSRDATLAFGEMATAPIVAEALRTRGVGAVAVDPREVIATDARHGAATPDEPAVRERIARVLGPLLAEGSVPVIGGFVGAARDGTTTTLGRGGSDLTASVLAAGLGAEALEFWKDVDGILTADPRIVPGARPIPRLTFREASELAFLGAGVLHPSSIQPAIDAGVPVRVLNSFCPEAPGTDIVRTPRRPAAGDAIAASIAHKRDQVLVNVHSTRMLGATGFLRRVFEVFDRLGVSVDHIATSEVNVTVTICAQPGAERLAGELSEVAAITTRRNVGVVSVVGERLANAKGAASRVLAALDGVEPRLLTYGGFGANLSVVVDDCDVEAVVRRLHDRIFGARARRKEARCG